jgi:hypothetical protein
MRKTFIPTMIALAAVVSSCTLGLGSTATFDTSDLSEFQGKYMTTFDILKGTFISSDRALTPFNGSVSGIQSRATVPTWGDTSYSLPLSLGATLTDEELNYPEPGQTSTWITENMGANVYLIKVTTTFPSYDPRLRQDEWYYILDSVDTGTWTNDDPICNPAGGSDAKYRAKNELTFRDGSVQTETIVDVAHQFTAFDIEGSLEYPTAFIPKTDGTATWSSVVVYTREYADSPNFSFWSGKRARAIVGVRYYTEHLNLAETELTGDTLVFEKAVTALLSSDGDFLDPSSAFYLSDLAASPEQSYLALNVVRQRIVYGYDTATDTPDYMNAVRDTRTKTRVLNIATRQDNYVTIIGDEAAEITKAYDTMWIPSGDELSTVTLDGSMTVFTKTDTSLTSTTSDSDPVEIFTAAPIGDVGLLYYSVIEEGAPIETLASVDIIGDMLDTNGNNVVAKYNGKQGTLLDNATYDLDFHDKGTVQAWVNIKKTTSFPGIVHAGTASDFHDEIWSLQFWNTNTPAFCVSANSGSTYDLVQSSEVLNLGKWYHLVATWDMSANFLKIYVNGVERGSIKFSKVGPGSTFASVSDVVIGSQFYDGTKTLNNYYGFDGTINGVLVHNHVWTAAEIKSFYNANKTKTASW